MSLTTKQEIFVQRLIEGNSQREAYKFAYNAENMKNETIDKRASELFSKGDIKGRYEELKNELKNSYILAERVQGIGFRRADEIARQMGIPEESLDKIFERFYKSDRSRSLDKNGVGLGLYIVKTIVCSHGEDISVTSQNGVTTFTFTVQLAEDPSTTKTM